MTRRLLTRATADELLLDGAHKELFDVHTLVVLLMQVHEAGGETDADPDGLSSSFSVTQSALYMIDAKLRLALKAMGQAL